MKNPIKAYLDLELEIKELKKKMSKVKDELQAALELSGKGEIQIGRYKAFVSKYSRTQIDNALVKQMLGKKYDQACREVVCSSLKVEGV